MKPALRTIRKLATVAFCALLFAFSLAAQSSDQNFPTPLTTNELSGTIKARDMGDPRATTYFYAFDGAQGDIFINVVTKNFSGDIDVFIADNMAPLTKMVVYAETDSSETGRLVYLRKAERLILRIEGRTPNDDPATFRIKLGGSFIALAPQKVEEAPTVAKTDANEPGIKVDSVGRIVTIVPKPRPTPKVVEPPPVKEPVAKSEPASAGGQPVKTTTPAKVTKSLPPNPIPKKPSDRGTVFENDTAKVTVAVPKPAEREPSNAKPVAKTALKKPPPGGNAMPTNSGERAPARTAPPNKSTDPLASVRLVIQMKDGTTFWLPMNEVLKFTVDKGVMTVIAKNGDITRYNILEVEKTTIQ